MSSDALCGAECGLSILSSSFAILLVFLIPLVRCSPPQDWSSVVAFALTRDLFCLNNLERKGGLQLTGGDWRNRIENAPRRPRDGGV